MRLEHNELSATVVALGSPKRLGFYVWDVESDTVVGCQTTAMLYGIDVDSLRLGVPISTFFERIHAGDLDRLQTASVFGTAGAFSHEFRIERPTRELIMVRTFGCRFLELGQPARHVGTIATVEAAAADPTFAMVDHCLAAYELAQSSGKGMMQHLLGMALL